MFELKGAEEGQDLGRIIKPKIMLKRIRNQEQMIGLGEKLKSRKTGEIVEWLIGCGFEGDEGGEDG